MHIAMQDAEEMEAEHGEGTAAVTISLPTYLDAAVWFSDETENREDVWRVVCHEFLHAHHAPVTELFNLAWDGLRNLEREVGSVCRKVAKMVVMEEAKFVEINEKVVPELLGPPRFLRDEKLEESQIGVVTGLAWTQAGGEVLYVEALKYKGKGSLILTGQLGDVMKESAHAAMAYARAHTEELGIPEDYFEKWDTHVHLPAGAIPKDGPSAGITMTTALVSLMTDVPVRHDIAMTGEVTLQGRVLPVGGIREKCLAALSQGIHTVIIPIANQKDLADIPAEFKTTMTFIPVENLDEVFAVCFDKSVKALKKATSPKTGKRGKGAAAASAA
jgi:ATP-dependent Lon protease